MQAINAKLDEAMLRSSSSTSTQVIRFELQDAREGCKIEDCDWTSESMQLFLEELAVEEKMKEVLNWMGLFAFLMQDPSEKKEEKEGEKEDKHLDWTPKSMQIFLEYLEAEDKAAEIREWMLKTALLWSSPGATTVHSSVPSAADELPASAGGLSSASAVQLPAASAELPAAAGVLPAAAAGLPAASVSGAAVFSGAPILLDATAGAKSN